MEKKLQKVFFILSLVLLIVSSSNIASASCEYARSIYGEDFQIGTMLKWSTSSEVDNKMFIIEKSEDGVTFEELGTVEGAVSSTSLKEYSYLDIMARSEQAFYRLRQVDLDGSSNLSDVVKVTKVHKNDFMVARMSSVTTKDYFNISIESFVDGELSYILRDWKGINTYEGLLELYNGMNELDIDLSAYDEGIYNLSLKMGTEEEILTIKRMGDERKENVASTRKIKKK